GEALPHAVLARGRDARDRRAHRRDPARARLRRRGHRRHASQPRHLVQGSTRMKIAILNDYQRAVPTLASFAKGPAPMVEFSPDGERDESKLAARLADFDAIILIRERTRMTASLLAKLPKLKLLVQTGSVGPQIDLAACRSRGVTVCAGGGSPVAPAELTWALILAALRHMVPEAERLRRGQWQGDPGRARPGARLGRGRFRQSATAV